MSYAQTIAAAPTEVTPELIDAMGKLYAPDHFERGFQAPKIVRDQPYGPNVRQRLDLHLPELSSDLLPILLFVPGGGFVTGDRHTEGTPYYDHIGRWATDSGMVAATMSYRLAPEAAWPAGAVDVAMAVTWLAEHAADFGADRDRIVLVGHSAGAAHVAGFLAGHGGDAIVHGAVLLSGIFSLEGAEQDDLLRAYYGSDPSRYPGMETVSHMVESKVPLLFGVAEHDAALFHRQAANLIDAYVTGSGRWPNLFVMQGHNHLSEIMSVGVDDSALSAAIRTFVFAR